MNHKTKFNAIIILTITVFSMVIFVSLNYADAYETDTDTKLNLSQEYDNEELGLDIISVGDYNGYEHPKIDDNLINHELSIVTLSNIQAFENVDYESNTQSISGDFNAIQSISEFLVGASFISTITLSGNFEIPWINGYRNEPETEWGSSNGGYIDYMSLDDGREYEIESEYETVKPSQYSVDLGTLTNSFSNLYYDDGNTADFDSEWIDSVGYVTLSTTYLSDDGFDQLMFEATTNYLTSCDISIKQNDVIYYSTDLGYSTNQYCLVQTADIGSGFDENEEFEIIVEYFKNGDNFHVYIDTLQLKWIDSRYRLEATIDLDTLSYQYFSNIDSIFEIAISSDLTFYDAMSLNGITLYSNENEYHETNNCDNHAIFHIILEDDSPFSIYIDYFNLKSKFNPLYSAGLSIEYEELGVNYDEFHYTDINVLSNTQDICYFECVFLSSELDNHNSDNDLTIISQELTFSFDVYPLSSSIEMLWYLSRSSNVWATPTEINLKLNGISIDDNGFNEGIVILYDYPEILSFTSNIDNIFFTFEVLTYYNYQFDLSVISYTYLKSILQLDFDDDLILDDCEFLFESEITHCYIQNVEYPNTKDLNLDLLWSSDTTCKFEVFIADSIYSDLNYISTTQISEDISITDAVTYQIHYSAPRYFTKWMFSLDYEIDQISVFSGEEEIPIINDGNNYLINYELQENDIITAELIVNPNYNVYYKILDESQSEIQLKVYYSAEIDVQDVDLLIELPFFFNSWDFGSQNEGDLILTLPDVDVSTTEEFIIITGSFQEPVEIVFDEIYNAEAFTIYEDFDSEIQYEATISQYGTKYGWINNSEAWTLNQIVDGENSIDITESDEFYYQTGLSEDAYLSFTCNPMVSFEVIELESEIIIQINMSQNASLSTVVLDLSFIEDHYELGDNDELDLHTLSDDQYYFNYNLISGMNEISIKINRYTGSSWWQYILIGLGIAAVIGIASRKIKKSKK